MRVNEIKNLDVKERIILMNTIWESLSDESPAIESPQWHEEILKVRVEKMKNNQVKIISLEELKSR
jgi:putative addiction module component (TIGR02574 family)